MTARSQHYVAQDLLLREQARAIRHLRPGTPLAEPANPLERQLLDDLRRLPNDSDPLLWLQAERGAVCAQLAVRLAVRYAVLAYQGRHTAASTAASFGAPAHSREEHPWLGGAAVILGATWEPPDAWAREVPEVAPPEQFVEVLAQLRRAARVPRDATPAFSLDKPGEEYLLADLLRLPDDTDPVQWLREERGANCARLALEQVLARALPPVDLLMARPGSISPMHPRARLSLGRTLRVTIEQVLFFEIGFAAYLQVRIGGRRDDTAVLAQWDGFDRVIDEEGHSYVIRIADKSASSTFRGWRERLTLACYPAVGPASVLTWLAQPAVLSRLRVPGDGGPRLIPLPSPSLGNLRWTMRIPR